MIDTQVTVLLTAQATVDNPDTRTKNNFIIRDAALETAKKTLRRIINFYVATNPNATEVDHETLRVPHLERAPLPSPTYSPGLRHPSFRDMVGVFPVYDPVTDKHAKPDGVLEIEAYIKVGGEEPAHISELTERRVATSSPMRIAFEPEQEFQMLYIAIRYIGTRGDYGPWSQIYKFVITR
jgi:hypothetical protein